MLSGWFRRRLQLAALKGTREDLERFVNSLLGQSDAEVGTVVAMAATVRVALRRSGLLPDELLRVTPEPQQPELQLAVAQLVRRYQAERRDAEATGAMVWLHSLRALSTPEVRYLGREMWRQLERGQMHALDVLREMGVPPLSDVTAECSRIPDDLNPHDVRR